ncbi:MAG: transporter [Verrucomicrobiota bacterium]
MKLTKSFARSAKSIRSFSGILAMMLCSLVLTGQSLRELETDRPDATESPVTVDKGHFQLESSFFGWSRDDSGGTQTEVLSIAESNLKYGLTDEMDLQMVWTPYLHETTKSAGGKTSVRDASDLVFRLKYNLWGNDEGETAFGLMPIVKVPTSSRLGNDEWEGGMVTPFAWWAGKKWSLGAQVEIQRIFDSATGKWDWEVSHTTVIGLDLTVRIGIYLEYLGVSSDDSYGAHFSSGITYALSDAAQLDAGSLVGLNDDAEDLTVFSGISWKF